MATLRVGDRVEIRNNKGIFIGKGTIANINEFRESSTKYAIDADFYKKDFVFAGEKHLKLIEEEIDNGK